MIKRDCQKFVFCIEYFSAGWKPSGLVTLDHFFLFSAKKIKKNKIDGAICMTGSDCCLACIKQKERGSYAISIQKSAKYKYFEHRRSKSSKVLLKIMQLSFQNLKLCYIDAIICYLTENNKKLRQKKKKKKHCSTFL